ncbi:MULTISPECIES: hypothetical protein [unclassified Microcoleus]
MRTGVNQRAGILPALQAENLLFVEQASYLFLEMLQYLSLDCWLS